MSNHRWAASAFAFTLAACTPPPAPNVATSNPPRKLDSPPTALESVDQPPATWAALVADERIWRAPDLDRFCDAARSAFFMPLSSGSAGTPLPPASGLGCAPPSPLALRSAHIADDPAVFDGQAYCCARTRSAALPHTGGVPSCQQAGLDYVLAENSSRPEDDSSGSIAAVLNRGSYFANCHVPDSLGIEICTAILEGRPVGVTVRTNPPSAPDADCIAESILHLTFPSSLRMDIARTKF